ncbi:MAG TPA: MgtC/SapB family protein, partial [Candidatus Manganitrophaceae bacterium]|nr:MgtC/SapB family protein [Candidatus Manganitrophaceae bacterium]
MPQTLPFSHWSYLETIGRLALALAVGLFVGLERERRGKEAGLRTFGFAALMGGLGGLLGESYALL